MTHKETVEAVRKRTAQIRGVLRIVETTEFQAAFDSANQQQKELILKIETTEGMREWIASALRRPLSGQTYRRLREMGFENHVKNYSRLGKEELIKALEAKGVKSDAGIVEKSQEPVDGIVAGPKDLQNPGTATKDAGSSTGVDQG